MGRIVSRKYLIQLVNQLYINQENNWFFLFKIKLYFLLCKHFFDTTNSNIQNWCMINLRENTNDIRNFLL